MFDNMLISAAAEKADELSIGDAAEAKATELRDRGFRFFELPAWEKSKDNVVYAEKK